jgi:hypothetical protein
MRDAIAAEGSKSSRIFAHVTWPFIAQRSANQRINYHIGIGARGTLNLLRKKKS